LTQSSLQAILDKSSFVSAQTYWYNVKNSFGCSNATRAKVTVNIDKGTKPSLDPKGIVLCANQKLTINDLKKGILTDPGAATIKWYASSISQTPLDGSTDISLFPSPFKFYATLTPVGGCESLERDNLTVSIITSQQTLIDSLSQTFCKNIPHLISDLHTSPNVNGSIVWFNKNKQALLPSDVLTEGTYYAAIVNQGCVSDKLAIITVNLPSFKIQTNVLPPVCHEENGQIKVLNTKPSYDYTWFLNNQILVSEKGSTLSKVGKGNYKVFVTNNSCPSDSLSVEVDCTLPKIPQIITPDNNGKNDYFVIGYYIEYPKVTLSIYNRWGTLVYQSGIPYKDDWDGKPSKDVMSIGTETLPTGTYYYVIDKGNGDPVEYGYLELVK
jgi:gliding motility-associated-like protein